MPNDTKDGQTKQKKGTWDSANMHKAVEKVLNNEMSARLRDKNFLEEKDGEKKTKVSGKGVTAKGKNLISGRDVSKKTKKLPTKIYVLPKDQLKKRQFALCVLNPTKKTGYSVETVRFGFMRLVQIYRSYPISTFVITVLSKLYPSYWPVLEANFLQSDFF